MTTALYTVRFNGSDKVHFDFAGLLHLVKNTLTVRFFVVVVVVV